MRLSAKNLALAGVKSLTLNDPNPILMSDLSSQVRPSFAASNTFCAEIDWDQFYFTEKDVGKNRAEVSAAQLQDLNPYVNIHVHSETLTTDVLSRFQVALCVLPRNFG